MTKTQLREQRLEQLLESCREQALQQLIGPFGLTPAMFNDRDGGNVTTQHNADKGIFAQESETFKRGEYQYAQAKKEKIREQFEAGAMNSQTFTDAYTGKQEATMRTRSDGKQVMNAEADHTIPLAQLHKQGGWMKDAKGRSKIASEKDNLHFTSMQNNRSKSDKAARSALSAGQGYDESLTRPLIDKAEQSVKQHLPSTMERVKYQGTELAIEGGKAAGINAIRQAMGVLVYEFANGSFIEIKQLLTQSSDESLIERVIAAMKRVAKRVLSKLKTAGMAALSGSIQGFVSTLLTFVINAVMTTSAKVVTLIRESMQSLWQAIKIMANPPEGLTKTEVARQVSKIIAGVVTMGLGMLLEESVKTFLLTIPLLAPIAEPLSLGIAGILSGIATALVIYGLDRFFDWLSRDNTAQLQAMESHSRETLQNIEYMADWLQTQYQTSQSFQLLEQTQQQTLKQLTQAVQHNMATTMSLEAFETASLSLLTHTSRMQQDYADTIACNHQALDSLARNQEAYRRQADELDQLLANFPLKEQYS